MHKALSFPHPHVCPPMTALKSTHSFRSPLSKELQVSSAPSMAYLSGDRKEADHRHMDALCPWQVLSAVPQSLASDTLVTEDSLRAGPLATHTPLVPGNSL